MNNYLLAYLIIGLFTGVMACIVDGKKTIRDHSWTSFIVALVILVLLWPVAMTFNAFIYFKNKRERDEEHDNVDDYEN